MQCPNCGNYISGGDDQPISAWGYVGYMVLFTLPVIGFILMLVFAFGSSQKASVKNFARAYLILWVIGVVLTILLTVIFGASLAGLASVMN